MATPRGGGRWRTRLHHGRCRAQPGPHGESGRARPLTFVRTASRCRRGRASPRSGGHGCTGRECGVTSISRSSAFISATESMRPARTEPWQAMVAATWSSFSLRLSALVEGGDFVGEVGDQALDVAVRRAGPGVARTSIAAGRTVRAPGPFRRARRRAPRAGRSRARRARPLRGGATPGGRRRHWPSPRRIRSSTSRSCAACWSTRTSPSSASATI